MSTYGASKVSDLLQEVRQHSGALLGQAEASGHALIARGGNSLAVAAANTTLIVGDEMDKKLSQLNAMKRDVVLSMLEVDSTLKGLKPAAYELEQAIQLDTRALLASINGLSDALYISGVDGLTHVAGKPEYRIEIAGVGLGIPSGNVESTIELWSGQTLLATTNPGHEVVAEESECKVPAHSVLSMEIGSEQLLEEMSVALERAENPSSQTMRAKADVQSISAPTRQDVDVESFTTRWERVSPHRTSFFLPRAVVAPFVKLDGIGFMPATFKIAHRQKRLFGGWRQRVVCLPFSISLVPERVGRIVASVTTNNADWELVRSERTPRTTGNHHCKKKCRGEPTRTNYTLHYAVTGRCPNPKIGDLSLRNPRLSCSTGPCPFSFVNYVQLSRCNTVADASVDVWSHATTWNLDVDVYQFRRVGESVVDDAQDMRFGQIVTFSAPPGARVLFKVETVTQQKYELTAQLRDDFGWLENAGAVLDPQTEQTAYSFRVRLPPQGI